jgi:ubiquinone/menaquinone biosynthesis C-methylase UbiE
MDISNERGTTWAEVWERQMDRWRRMRRGRGADPACAAFWDSLNIWEDYERYTNYPGPLIRPVLDSVDSNQTVLDIGAGSGSFTLPVARQAGWVTAVEPSSSQCRRLMQAAAFEGIVNISVIQKDWNSVGLEEVGRHDIVVASYCLFMTGIVAAVSKMFRLARRRVFLVHLAGHDLQDMVREIRESDAEVPAHRLLLHVLKEMGLNPKTRVFSRDYALPLHLQLEMFRSAQGFTDSEIRELEKALEVSGRIEVKNGEPWITRTYQDALIAIDAELGART